MQTEADVFCKVDIEVKTPVEMTPADVSILMPEGSVEGLYSDLISSRSRAAASSDISTVWLSLRTGTGGGVGGKSGIFGTMLATLEVKKYRRSVKRNMTK